MRMRLGVDRAILAQPVRRERRHVEDVGRGAVLRVERQRHLPHVDQLVDGAVLVVEVPHEGQTTGQLRAQTGATPRSSRGKHRLQCCATPRVWLK